MENDPYLGEYFGFGIRNPWSEHIYGEDITNGSCVLFQKRKKRLFAVGEESINWINNYTDEPPQLKEAISFLELNKINRILTTSLIHYDDLLWELRNQRLCANHDYDADPFPSVDIYFSLDEGFVDKGLKKVGIQVLEVRIAQNYLNM